LDIRRILKLGSPLAVLFIALVSMCAQISRADGNSGDVYVMTNQPSGNSIIVFHREPAGTLRSAGSFATGGNGAGIGVDPLGSQGSLVLSEDQRLLFAVNAGSSSVSVFAVSGGQLRLLDTIGSGGVMPVSVTVKHDMVFVVNAGGIPNISGFTIDPETNRLLPLPGSTRNLPGGAAAAPAQISFTPDGGVLVVTEKGTNQIDTFTLDEGIPGPAVSFASNGIGPFGFAFGHDNITIVSDAGSGAASSYQVEENGKVTLVSAALANTQAAPCWLIVSQNRRFAYTANAGSGTISSYTVSEDGKLLLLQAVAASTGSGTSPTDMTLSGNGRFLYVRTGGTGSVRGFRVEADGGLTLVATAAGVPGGAQGIAAR
jgi:6-phosphogluconolactonase (cycloisomerase 2 family)